MEWPFIVAIVAIVVIGLPSTIMHYITEWRKTKAPSADDERLVDDLWRTAQRLESRVESLESILDREAPRWREEHRETREGSSRGGGPRGADYGGAEYRGRPDA